MNNKAQSIIEFTFAMILVAFLIFGLVKIFQWSGLSLAEHRIAHDHTLIRSNKIPGKGGALFESQVNDQYFEPKKMNAMYKTK